MSARGRLTVFLCAGSVLGALVFWGLTGLPPFGHYQGAYGNQLEREVMPERHTTNIVGAVVFDYRGLDTLGEEFILFSALVGVALLLRKNREQEIHEAHDDTARNDALRFAGLLLAAPMFLLGLWLAAFGYVTPGGGFQGGVLLAGAVLLVYLTGSVHRYSRLTPSSRVEVVEAVAVGAFAVLGLVGLIAKDAYLHNFLGAGHQGTLWSGGSIPLLNWATAVAVTAAMLLLFNEFLEEYVA